MKNKEWKEKPDTEGLWWMFDTADPEEDCDLCRVDTFLGVLCLFDLGYPVNYAKPTAVDGLGDGFLFYGPILPPARPKS